MKDRGFVRVSVMVPYDYVEWVRTFGRLIRSASPDDLDQYRDELEAYLRDCYSAYDDDVAAGRYVEQQPSSDD